MGLQREGCFWQVERVAGGCDGGRGGPQGTQKAVQSVPMEVWCFSAERRKKEFFSPVSTLRVKGTTFQSLFLCRLGKWNSSGVLWLVLPETGAGERGCGERGS